jgi:hypothetical protein
VIGGPAGPGWRGSFEAQGYKVQSLDEGVDNSHWVLFTDVVVQPLRQQRSLRSMFLLNEARHCSSGIHRHKLLNTQGTNNVIEKIKN